MIKIAVCDDDEKDLSRIAELVGTICRDEEVTYELKTYSSGEELLAEANQVDVAVLDIVLHGMNGIDLGVALKKKFPQIKLIYLTSYEEYCRQAVNRAHAFAFLTKPVAYGEMRAQLAALFGGMERERSVKMREFYHVRTEDGAELGVLALNIGDIAYFESMKLERKIKIVCGAETYTFSYVMDKLARELKDDGFGVNCRGMLVNLRHVRKVKGYTLYMDNGAELALSQKRKTEFVRQLNLFMCGMGKSYYEI